MLRLIVLFMCFFIFFSCSMRKENKNGEAILYKQSTSANDASFSFEKKCFGKLILMKILLLHKNFLK
ncbi:hypothetical protein CLV73_0376 [Chryseobacterium geocarposphaerae]|uniref:Lipoprotein n=1 Tax=Chryseobacterium geocarposphaerae TaxID=1416776 RepID=A0A2M9C6C9_9FLAO|nr:hypothetical protein CLV73_0376 [Chryseobacterium geocarposphaerae]